MTAPLRTPFSILTGFLGAGKTTVLNRLLGAGSGHGVAPGRRIAVLINELGRIAIDSRLIVARGDDVLELAGGCVCCTIDVRNDLWDGIADVIARSRPDHVVLETTGIAEPDAILRGLERLPPAVRGRIHGAGVICVVDAEAGVAQLVRRAEAAAQVAAADRVLLSKLDLAAPAGVEALHARLRELAPAAERAAFPPGVEGDAALGAWLLEVRAPRPARARDLGSRPHLHRGQVTAASFVGGAPLLPGPLLELVEAWRDRLLRVKGFVHIVGRPERGYLELAGTRAQLRYGESWSTSPTTELVFIGEDLDEAELRRRLWACQARS
jgi:G3E family GTPase